MNEVKQIFQNLNSGETILSKIPKPKVSSGYILIKTDKTLISAGTERMLVDFGKANLLQKAKSQPEKVRQVIDKIKTDGLFETIDAVKTKLNQPLPLGYSNVGTIIEIGKNCENAGLKIGDRVLSNGAHSEIVCVPKNLCIKIPDLVKDEEASFGVIASIALQGIRLSKPLIGETFAVFGLGLIGLITVQILKANGCKVIGLDFNQQRLNLAKKYGAEIFDLQNKDELQNYIADYTKEQGVDGVLITAATKSNDPVTLGAQISRQRGRIILVGVSGLELRRDDFYKKELSFQVSCSYGPGRYDKSYEAHGNDYPFGLVRWTEKRNFEAVLELMQNRKIDIKDMISHHYSIDNAINAYQMISENQEPYLGIIINYNNNQKTDFSETIQINTSPAKTNNPVIGVIGAGNFTGRILLNSIAKTKVDFKTITSSQGINSTHLAKKFSFTNSSTNNDTIFHDNDINTVFITTRHNTHADLILKSLANNKNIFVEKPLCLTLEELNQIKTNYEKLFLKENQPTPLLMVGFNRRFSPFTLKIKELLKTTSAPKSFIYTINAGFIPKDHWIQDKNIGGGRIIGEVCHFIDLISFIAESEIDTSSKITMQNGKNSDSTIINLTFQDGSIATVNYLSNGSKSYPKENLTIFCNEKILVLNNFRSLKGYGFKNFKKLKSWKIDKGHNNCVSSFIDAIKKGEKSPIPFDEILKVTKTSIELSC